MKYFLLSLLIFLTASATNAVAACDQNYTVGVVPQFEQRRLFSVWQPILTELSQQTSCQFTLKGSENIQAFETAFLAGEYDLAYLNPYHAVMAHKAQGYEPIVRSGAKKLFGILVVKKDSDIKELAQLNSKTLAFPSPNALGAALLMRAELANTHKLDIQAKYVKTHSSVYLHVAKGLHAAGGGVMRTFNEQPAYIRNKLRILYKTPKVNAHPLVVHPRVAAAMGDAIQTAWLAAAAKAPELMAGIPMQESIATSMADYEDLQAMGLEDFVVR